MVLAASGSRMWLTMKTPAPGPVTCATAEFFGDEEVP